MKTKLLLTTLFGVAAWSLSSLAMANWDTGPCSGSGSAPCIETEINGNTYHFNGSGGHAGVWHGRPQAEGGGDFSFSGPSSLECDGTPIDCTLSLTGEVKKCLDSDDNWRIGVRVNASNVQAGDFACNFIALDGFPWYSKDTAIGTPDHCPFEDNCDTFIPYDSTASSYTANFGLIDIDVLGSTEVSEGHVHSVVFNPGVGANFVFASDFFNCEEGDEGCSVDGTLTLNNGTSLDIN
jgi:hypothetical protein